MGGMSKKRTVPRSVLCILVLLLMIGIIPASVHAAEGEAVDYSMDRPLLMRGKSLEKAASSANVTSLEQLKTALSGNASEIYINEEIKITENLDIPAGKLLLRGYNRCYGTMFVVPSGVTVTVRSEIDASGDQTKLYTGPVFDVQAGGKLQILSGSIYGSVSENNGGAITNDGTVDIKGGIIQGHTTTKSGGAIYNNGKLTITGGQLLSNRAMANASVNAGGAIYNTANGTVLLSGGVSRTNFSLGHGGAIYNEGNLTIDQGRILLNRSQKSGNGIYSTQDVTYTGKNYTNTDEVVSKKDVILQGSGFANASVVTAASFRTASPAENQSNGKITCTSLSGEVENQGHIYYNGTGTFAEKITGGGWFHTSGNLTMDAPAFACGIMLERGELTMANASMGSHEIMVSSGVLKSGSLGKVKVKCIAVKGGTYLIEEAPYSTAKEPLGGCKYLDTAKILCSGSGELIVKGKDNPILNGKDTYYVPIGKQLTMNQNDVNSAILQNSSGVVISEKGQYQRSYLFDGGVTYLRVQPADIYELKVLFEDENGKRQMFPQENLSVSLWNNSGYTATAAPVTDGFATEGNANYGAYLFTEVPSGRVTVYASFTGGNYRSLSGGIDMRKDDEIILRPQKYAVPLGVWWTDEGNYDVAKYNELKGTAPGQTVQVSNAKELAAVAKIVSWPKDEDTPKNLNNVTINVTGDIDLDGFQWRPIGYQGKQFTGKFNGGSHTIRNMSIGFPEVDKSLLYGGLFGYCGYGSVIWDVILDNYVMKMEPSGAPVYIGGLVGWLSGEVKNCSAVNGEMNIMVGRNSNIGGLIGQTGYVSKSSVSNLKLSMTSTNESGMENSVGGFAGRSLNGGIYSSKVENAKIYNYTSGDVSGGFIGTSIKEITNCYSDTVIRSWRAGGFAGRLEGATVKNCFSKGNVEGTKANGFAAIVKVKTKILDCYSESNVNAYIIGGFIGELDDADIRNCYSSGNLKYPMIDNSNVRAEMSAFAHEVTGTNVKISNSYYVGNTSEEEVINTCPTYESGFIGNNTSPTKGITVENNYSLATINHKGPGMAGGFGTNLSEDDNYNNNFYYSNITRPTTNNVNDGITRMISPDSIVAGKHSTVIYSAAKDLPGGARVKSLQLDENLPGASVKKLDDTTYEITPLIDFGVIHLSGEMVVSHAKLNTPTGSAPDGWDFQVSPEDTTMSVTEDLLLCKVDFENEEILAPNLDKLQKGGKNGVVDSQNSQILRFPVQDGDFDNLVLFSSPEIQSTTLIPGRPKVPLVNCRISGDKQVLMFTTNREHITYTEENAIRPNTKYEYSLDGGNSYQSVTSTSDGKVMLQLTAGLLSNWTGITGASDIKDARLRLAATDGSFRSKAMAEETQETPLPPEESTGGFQVTYYLNDGSNKIYQVDTATDGKVSEPKAPERKGFVFHGWYKERVPQGDAPYDFSQTVTESLKLYANWQTCSYTIRTETDAPEKSTHVVYDVSQNPADATAEGQFLEGSTVVLDAESTDSLYTFLYWKEGDTVISEKAKFELEVTKDQTFTACFQSNKPKAPTPDAPTYHTLTDKEIHVDVITGQEYAIRKEGEPDYGPWQSSGDFTNLESLVTYQIVTRIPENDNFAASDMSQPLTVTTLKTRSHTIKTQTDAPGKSTNIVYEVSEGSAGARADGVFLDGATVVLEATATDTMYTFLCWKEGDTIVSNQAKFEIKAVKDQTFTACFQFNKPKAPTPAVPVCYWLTDNGVGITEIPGQQYAIKKADATEYGPWQASGRFDNLESLTRYQVITRVPESDTFIASDMSQPLTVETLKPGNQANDQLPTPAPEPPAPETPSQKPSGVYTVTFMDGAAVISSQMVEKGTAATAPEITKIGYQLSWSIPYSNITSDLIVRAVWKPNVYTITLKPNGGKMTGNSKQTAVYDRKYDKLPKPTRSGYAFKGWYHKKSGGSMITENTVVKILKNTTYYAQWSKISLKKPNLKSLKNEKKYTLKATWTTISNADGYQLEYSTDKKFKKKDTKIVKVSKPKKGNPTKSINKLKKGKTYYVRVTAYKKDSTGKKIYSSKSNVKNVVIKK